MPHSFALFLGRVGDYYQLTVAVTTVERAHAGQLDQREDVALVALGAVRL